MQQKEVIMILAIVAIGVFLFKGNAKTNELLTGKVYATAR